MMASGSLEGPSVKGFTVTPSDSTVFSRTTRGVYVGTAGNVNVRWQGDQSNTVFVNVPAGTILPVRVDMVFATSTTASNIVGLY